MRVVALLACKDEARFIGGCIDHLIEQGIEVHVTDDGSTDETLDIVHARLGDGVIGVERSEGGDGTFRLRRQLARKEELAATLGADWYVHLDPDEIRLAPRSDQRLVDAFAEAEDEGSNAVEFLEFVFLPTQEEPDHDHPRFLQTMRSYHPFRPRPHHRLNAWRQPPGGVDLVGHGGHEVVFPGRQVHPEPFRMRHYLFLSEEHARQKYGRRSFDPDEVALGWHGWRDGFERVRLPAASELCRHTGDDALDPSDPWGHADLERTVVLR